jgi:hypothetical protein
LQVQTLGSFLFEGLQVQTLGPGQYSRTPMNRIALR